MWHFEEFIYDIIFRMNCQNSNYFHEFGFPFIMDSTMTIIRSIGHATHTDVDIDMHIIVMAFIDKCILIVGSV